MFTGVPIHFANIANHAHISSKDQKRKKLSLTRDERVRTNEKPLSRSIKPNSFAKKTTGENWSSSIKIVK